MSEQAVGFDLDTANAILDMLNESASGGRDPVSTSYGSIDVYFIRVTSLTLASGRYPGTRYSYDPVDNAFTAEDDIWVVEVNGGTPALSTYYPAIRSGYAEDKVVWLIRASGGGGGLGAIKIGSDFVYGDATFDAITFTISVLDNGFGPLFTDSGSTITLTIPPANNTVPGLVDSSSQTWKGLKYFTEDIKVKDTISVVDSGEIRISYADWTSVPTTNILQLVVDSNTATIASYPGGIEDPFLDGRASTGIIFDGTSGTATFFSTDDVTSAIIATRIWISVSGGSYHQGSIGFLSDGSRVDGGIITDIGTDGMNFNKAYRLMGMGLH